MIVAVVVSLLVGVGVIADVVNRATNDGGTSAGSFIPSPPTVSPIVPGQTPEMHRPTHTSTVTADRTADGTVVDKAMAENVLSRYWPMHEQALVDRNLTALRGMSVGAARRWEQAAVACGCLHVFSPRPLLDTAYFVPRQTSFPATFVTEALTEVDGSYWAELLVFTKRAAGARWLVSEDSGFGPPAGLSPTLGSPDLGHGSYDQPVSAVQSAIAHHVADRLAAVWQRAKDTGRIPTGSGFDLTGQTGARVANLAAYPQDQVQVDGSVGHYSFSTSAADPLIQVSDAGNDLACQPIREVVQHRALPGEAIRQDSAHEPWGPNVAPGDYQRVTTTDVWQTCFLIPPQGDPIKVLDQDIGGALGSVPSATT